jgi:hypothetical protein
MSNYYLCGFLEIIDNKKIEENDKINDDGYILHIKKYVIRNYSGIER